MKYKLLFVDDEPQILEGIQDSLRKYRKQWNMTFICGGEAAIAEMDAHQFDVVICDMRMPKVDGVAVLRHAKKCYPAMVRIVLSGYSEIEHTISVSSLAHRYLTKPCDPNELASVIQRSVDFAMSLDFPSIKEIAGNVVLLPVNDKQNQCLLELLHGETASLPEITAILSADISLTTKLLHLVNSAFFRQQRSIDSAKEAATYLGADLIKNIISVSQFYSVSDSVSSDERKWVSELQQQSWLTAHIAQYLMRDTEYEDAAYTAALLLNVGMLVLVSERPDLLKSWQHSNTNVPVTEFKQSSESGVVNIDQIQRDLGAYFLNLWGVPDTIVEAVSSFACPSAHGFDSLNTVGAVHIANYLAQLCTATNIESIDASMLDEQYLEAIGVTGRMDEWVRSAQDIVDECLLNSPFKVTAEAA